MPRPLELTVQPWPRLGPKPYPMEILSLRKKGQGLRVTLRHLVQKQAGREHHVVLSLPLRPEPHPSTLFFKALGYSTHVGAEIRPREAVGRRLLVTFGPSADGADPMPVGFAPVKEKDHAERAESAGPSTETAPEPGSATGLDIR